MDSSEGNMYSMKYMKWGLSGDMNGKSDKASI
jgi:hypothetical protein